jgi:transmembrane sensor
MTEPSDLLRLIEGTCSPDEAAAIQAWIAQDPRRAALLDELRAVWRLTGDTVRSWDIGEAGERLLEARDRRPARPDPFPARPRVLTVSHGAPDPAPVAPRAWRVVAPPARVAALLALALAGTVVWRLRLSAAPPREYATARGQRSELSFPDGSRVLLGVASRLRVPRDYGVRERAVELEGEAYFVVRHDPRRPFRVRTRHGTTEDLGTAFDVRAYGQEQYLQVVVAAGRVALRGVRAGSADSVALTLHPRDRGVIDARGNATTTSGVSLQHYLAWTRGTLAFDNAPLSSVTAQLSRWYDLDIQTDRSLRDERLTIAFTTPSADEALAALAQVLDARATRAERVVRLVPMHPRR